MEPTTVLQKLVMIMQKLSSRKVPVLRLAGAITFSFSRASTSHGSQKASATPVKSATRNTGATTPQKEHLNSRPNANGESHDYLDIVCSQLLVFILRVLGLLRVSVWLGPE